MTTLSSTERGEPLYGMSDEQKWRFYRLSDRLRSLGYCVLSEPHEGQIDGWLAGIERSVARIEERLAGTNRAFEADAVDAWNSHAGSPDYEAAWREMQDHLSWMQGCKALPPRYLGMNFAAIANDLIERAYPGLRDGSPPPTGRPPLMAREFIEWMESCWPSIGPQTDFNLGVKRGFEIIKAQIESGHTPLSSEQVPS
jgi:hypothetical protein